MSDTKWTPGPWTYAVRNNHEIQCSFVGVVIGKEYMDVGFINNKEDHANAHLIAAAPELYEALMDMVTSYEALGAPLPMSREVEVALSALEKARGES